MQKLFLAALAVLASVIFATAADAQATYSYEGVVYDTLQAAPGAPTVGTNRVYNTATHKVTGSFTTAAPLAANLAGAAVTPTAYSFTDGTGGLAFSSTDANRARISQFTVSTNASGQVTTADITVHLWQDNVATHSTTFTSLDSRFDTINIAPAGVQVRSNLACTTRDAPSDTCTAANLGEANGASNTTTAGVWTSPVPVPTMTEWALILLGVILAGTAALVLSRRTPGLA